MIASSLRSRWPDIELPEVALPEFVLHRAAELGDKPAIIDAVDGRGYTYAELLAAVRSQAAGLSERGVGTGDVVALLLPNVPEYPVIFHGALLAGAATTTLNPLYREAEIAHQLADSGARVLFTVAEHAEKAAAAARGDGVGVREIVVIDDPDAPLRLDDVFSDAPPPEIQITPGQAIAALPYSSGTTGLPKGVMLSHRNLAANVLQTHASQTVSKDDVVLAVLPFFHIYGMTVTMNYCLWAGATIVSSRRFDADALPATLQDYGITRLYAVPPIILGLAKREDLDCYGLSRLRGVLSGAAPLDADTAQLCASRIGCRVTQGYGMTELSPCTHLTPPDDPAVPPASIGPALPSTECKIVNPVSGEPVGVGHAGELCVRGPQVMLGYLGNDDATRSMIDDEGFLHTGDLATVDESGYYYVLDRLKELIKFKGFQIAPAELEAVLVGHDSVIDAAVIGVPDPEAGEVPKALVVTNRPMAEADILAYVAERVAPHKRVRVIEFVDAIPKSPSGKLLRGQLRERERQLGELPA
ncbi:MAG: AMP-binding protein [Solirubrobacterales bacterium]|nr:AMP-binding protein [Solirubrobacterales bacterium]